MGVPTKTVPPPKTDEKPGKLTWKGNTGTKTEPKVEKMSDDDEPPKITFVPKKDRLKRDGKQPIKTEKVDKGLARLADFPTSYRKYGNKEPKILSKSHYFISKKCSNVSQ